MRELRPMVEREGVSPWPTMLEYEALRSYFYPIAGQDFGDAIGEFAEGKNRWALDVGQMRTVADRLTQRVVENPTWVEQQLRTAGERAAELLLFGEQNIYRANLRERSDEELVALYREFRRRFFAFFPFAWISEAAQGPRQSFGRVLKDYLMERLAKIGKEGKIAEYFSILTDPVDSSTAGQEQRSFLATGEKIAANNRAKTLFRRTTLDEDELADALRREVPAVHRAMLDHMRQFEWMPFGYEGPAWDRHEFLRRWRTMVRRKTNPVKAVEKLDAEREKRRAQQKELEEEIQLRRDGNYHYLFIVARQFLLWNDRRGSVATQSFFHADKLIEEMARRIGVDSRGIRYAMPAEVPALLLQPERREAFMREVDKRWKYSVVVVTKNSARLLVGKPAEDFGMRVFRERAISEDIVQLEGDPVFPGKARGSVRLVVSIDDIARVRQGDIVVTPRANPNMVAAFRRAGAVVADTGGITSHAAIMCRDLSVPCVVGTDIASDVLADGDQVEVDAGEGVVTIIRKRKR